MKKIIKICGIIILFFLLKNTAFASLQTGWQTACNDFDNKNITFVVRGEIYPDYCITDNNGYKYWKDIIADLDYTPSSTFSSVSTNPSWHLWILSRYSPDMIPDVLYFDNSENPYFLTGGASTTDFIIDGNQVFLIKYDNFLYSLIHKIDIYKGGQIGGFYFLVYTDQDLSYINTQSEAYNYMDNLGVPPSIQTQFSNFYPPDNTIATTTPTTFSFEYFYNESVSNFSNIGIEITGASGTSTITKLLLDDIQNGQNYFSTSTDINLSGNAYMWRGVMYSTTTKLYYYSPYLTLIAQAGGIYIPPELPIGLPPVPPTLRHTFPFAYYFDYQDILNSYSGTSSTQSNFPNLSLSLFHNDSHATTVPLLNYNNFIMYIGENNLTGMRTGLKWILWAGFGLFMFKSLKGVLHK